MGFNQCMVFIITSYVLQMTCGVKTIDSEFKWNYINFTWPSQSSYKAAIEEKTYIPKNVGLAGMKIHKQNMYLSLPKNRNGVPVTLTYINMNENKINQLLIPYPSWEMNTQPDCSNLKSVQSIEIDTKGVMWVLDGHRTNNNTQCPPKMVWLDLNNNGTVIRTYTVPNEVCLHQGCFLNDIVIDEAGSFAYMTDSSVIDPGLIVYSFEKNHSWKIRDRTMYQELEASNFVVHGTVFPNLLPVDGIALSPLKRGIASQDRTVYFSAVTAYSLYSIQTSILKNEMLCRTYAWRKDVKYIGKKQSQTDGMIMDNEGNLYYTLLPLNAVGKWNINTSFKSSEVTVKNDKDMIWPDAFTFDDSGNLYVIATRAYQYINQDYPLQLHTKTYQIQIFKIHTGTGTYQL